MFDSLLLGRGLSLERLKVLIEVHDAGSISKSAPGDSVRHSQYSRQLRELSEFFGCEMTQRRGKLLKLTAQGARLAEMTREFLRGLEDFHSECKNEKAVFNIGAGDSLIQWLVIPRLGKIMRKLPSTSFSTKSLQTQEIVNQIAASRIDFGLVRKNALVPGMESCSLGMLSYVAVIPKSLVSRRTPPSFHDLFTDYPVAMQATEGQFTCQLRDIALKFKADFRPSLSCQSFPQVFAAVRSGKFAAILPEIASAEFPSDSVHVIAAQPFRPLQREIVLMWNSRVIKVRPKAAEVLSQMQSILMLR